MPAGTGNAQAQTGSVEMDVNGPTVNNPVQTVEEHNEAQVSQQEEKKEDEEIEKLQQETEQEKQEEKQEQQEKENEESELKQEAVINNELKQEDNNKNEVKQEEVKGPETGEVKQEEKGKEQGTALEDLIKALKPEELKKLKETLEAALEKQEQKEEKNPEKKEEKKEDKNPEKKEEKKEEKNPEKKEESQEEKKRKEAQAKFNARAEYLWNLGQSMEMQPSAADRKRLFQSALLYPQEDPTNRKKRRSMDEELEFRAARGTLNYNELANRAESLYGGMNGYIQSAMQTGEQTAVNQRELESSILGVMSKALQVGYGKSVPGKEKVQAIADNLSMRLGGSEALPGLSQNLALQNQPRGTEQAPKENSAEHQEMTAKQNLVCQKLALMNGEPVQGISDAQRKKLMEMPLSILVEQARASTFEYMRLKSDNGRKRSFVHKEGEERYHAAARSLEELDRLSDNLNLRSPAQKLIDDARKEMMANRGNEQVTKDCAAKILLGQAMLNERVPPERQARMLSPENLSKGLSQIQNAPTFNRMMSDEGVGDIVSMSAEGADKLYRAYYKADRRENPKKYAEIDERERRRKRAEKALAKAKAQAEKERAKREKEQAKKEKEQAKKEKEQAKKDKQNKEKQNKEKTNKKEKPVLKPAAVKM